MTRARPYLLVPALALALAACGDDAVDPDASVRPDASVVDANVPGDAATDDADVPPPDDAGPGPVEYSAEDRTFVVEGVTRRYVLARPETDVPMAPLVIALHGDGGSGAGMRAALRLEEAPGEPVVVAYLSAASGTFPYYAAAGRATEATVVRALIDELVADMGVDRRRVFLVGFSGGATMANALGCRLGADVIQGLGIHSGSLYPVEGDFAYTGTGGVTCDFPATIFVWGREDRTGGVAFETGESVRDNVRATHACQATTTATEPGPCVAYDGCARDVVWCAIDGLGHSLWGQAGVAFRRFVDAH